MPRTFAGLLGFAVVATLTVIVGLAIYNRASAYLPFLRTVTAEA